MMQGFKAFIAKGNVLDLAVAVIIGAAFATIATSLTEDIIMPVVGALFGGLDFASHFILLGPVPDGYKGSMTDYAALKAAGAPVLGWGQFITVVINFLILAFIIFLLVRWATKLVRRRDEAGGPSEVELLTEIRDELRKR
jgi:large conductance mechanosensitive channel